MEQELKLQILDPSPVTWEKICKFPLLALGEAPALKLHAVYYDSRFQCRENFLCCRLSRA